MDNGLFRERGRVCKVENFVIVLAQARCPVQERAECSGPGFTQMRLPLGTIMAGATDRVERQHNMVTLFDRGHAGANLGHHPGALMTQNHGQRHPHIAGHDVQITMTGTVGRHLDLDLSGFWRVDV